MLKAIVKRFLPPRLWAQLRVLRIQNGIKTFRRRTVVHTFGRDRLQVLLADPQGAGWYDHDWQVLPELELLQQGKLKSGARVFDIGAHQCVVALLLANVVGENGFVLALEPNHHNVEVGEQNKMLNSARQISIVMGAVAESTGIIGVSKALNAQVADGAQEWGFVKVPSYSIDDLSREYGIPDVIFLDVEGYECQALSGARETLRSGPDCFVEVHLGEGLEKFGTVSKVLSFFPQEDFCLYVRTEGQPNFAPMKSESELPQERFFLVALHR